MPGRSPSFFTVRPGSFFSASADLPIGASSGPTRLMPAIAAPLFQGCRYENAVVDLQPIFSCNPVRTHSRKPEAVADLRHFVL
jgi:hypothetical protein